MKTLNLLFAISLSSIAISQEKPKETARETRTIYGEIFGQGFAGSINYDKLFNTDSKVMNSHTFGLTFVPKVAQFGSGLYTGGHYSYNYIFGKKSHHLELGLGVSVLYNNGYSNSNNFYSYLTPKIGYRYQRPTGGLFFKAAATPMIGLLNVRSNSFGESKYVNYSMFNNVVDLGYRAFPWVGFGVGYTFK